MRAMRVLFRGDGGGPLGVGHLVRTLALVEELRRRGHDALLAGHVEGDLARRLLEAADVPVLAMPPARPGDGLEAVAALLEEHPAQVLHVDHYDLAPLPAGGHLPGGTLLSSMEEGSFGRRRADVVIDPTVGAQRQDRPDDGSAWVLRGSEFAAIRRSVRDQRRVRPGEQPEQAGRVLVQMGGTDPLGLTPLVVRALARTGLPLQVSVVVRRDHVAQVREAAGAAAHLDLDLHEPGADATALLGSHDLVVSAAGTTVWELCCVGAPMALVQAVDNQQDGYARVVAAGAATGLGGPQDAADAERTGRALRELLLDRQARQAMATAAAGLVDGLGAWRIVGAWEHALVRPAPVPPVLPEGWTVRAASRDDAELLWEWRRHVDAHSSRSGRTVTRAEHESWLVSSLGRRDRVLLLVSDAVGDVGTVRWDEHAPGDWEVSITVAPSRRGQGLARSLLAAGEVELTRGREVTAYLAVVHEDNEPSRRLFDAAGYLPDLPPDEDGFARFRRPGPGRVTR